eukprot:m.1639287 g.1639287  ORF g.1639287 m.1639287 type:complete len:541 (-) comp34400_c0_seq1:433-2055(-)
MEQTCVGFSAETRSEVCEAEEPPDAYVCAITHEVMVDPVSTADGHAYERDAIVKWLERNDTSPRTGCKLENKSVTENHGLRSAIDEWKQRIEARARAREKETARKELDCDQYILKSTGRFVTAKWLVDNRHDLNDSVRVDEFVQDRRDEFHRAAGLMASNVSSLQYALRSVEHNAVRLEGNHLKAREKVENAVQLISTRVTAALHRCRDEFLEKLDESFRGRRSVLMDQVLTLSESLETHKEQYESTVNMLDLSDIDILEAHATETAGGLVEGRHTSEPGPLPILYPAASSAMSMYTEESAVARACLDLSQALKLSEISAPELHGYEDASPRYVCGQEIHPNVAFYIGDAVSFRMDPSVPIGLILDTDTGVLSGTPIWDDSWEGAEVHLGLTVVVENDAGCAETILQTTIVKDGQHGQNNSGMDNVERQGLTHLQGFAGNVVDDVQGEVDALMELVEWDIVITGNQHGADSEGDDSAGGAGSRSASGGETEDDSSSANDSSTGTSHDTQGSDDADTDDYWTTDDGSSSNESGSGDDDYTD